MIGEAKALRALAYFYLVRTYKEVPYVDEPSITDDQNYNRKKSSEEYILEKIEEDLLVAEKVVRSQFDKTANTKGRITKNGVRAILADVYLWRDQFGKCIVKCDEIMADTTVSLVKSIGNNIYSQIFGRGNSTESIFELQYNNDIQWNNATKRYYGTSGNADDIRGEFYAPQYIVKEGIFSPFSYSGNNSKKKEAPNDIRLKYSIREETASGMNYIFKYAGSN